LGYKLEGTFKWMNKFSFSNFSKLGISAGFRGGVGVEGSRNILGIKNVFSTFANFIKLGFSLGVGV